MGVVPPAAAGDPQSWELSPGDCLRVPVPSNTTALVTELAWDDYTQRLALHAVSEDGAQEKSTTNDPLPILVETTLRLEVPSPSAGTWSLCVRPNGVDAGVRYTLYGSVFQAPVPEGFTALPGER